jgi:ABC-type nickel/cobalt efflux system permease component RcnA
MLTTALFYVTLFLLGMAHGLEPGHGKLLVTGYLAGNRAKIADALLLGLLVAFFHTMSVGVLGAAVVALAYTFFPTRFLVSIEVLSGLVILGLGLLLFWRRFVQKNRLEDSCDCHLLHEKPVAEEAPVRSQTTFKEVLALGFASGLTPCPLALAALIAAFGMGKPIAALGALAIFSLGIGFVLVVLGVALIWGSDRFAGRFLRWKTAPVWIARVSTLVVLLLGCYLVTKPFLFPADLNTHGPEERLHFLLPQKHNKL